MSETTIRKYSLFPKTLEQCVEPMLRPVFKDKGLAGSRLLTEWASIIGHALASHTLPEKLAFPPGKKSGGVLTISVENGFATELQHMQPVILERLAGYFGYAAVNRIAISHTWLPAEPVKTSALAPSKGPAINADITATVEDSELKAALVSLARTLSGQ